MNDRTIRNILIAIVLILFGEYIRDITLKYIDSQTVVAPEVQPYKPSESSPQTLEINPDFLKPSNPISPSDVFPFPIPLPQKWNVTPKDLAENYETRN